MKVIIWGYPLYSHTHSYGHNAFYKAFKHMGYDTYWFHDESYPKDFNYSDCIFWTEGFADKNIPLIKNSIYFVHVCPNPAKYLNSQVKKFIDVRPSCVWISDHVYNFTLDKTKVEKLGPCVYYEPKKEGTIKVKNTYYDYEIEDYDKLYITWATNLLPYEINICDSRLPRENVIHFCGNFTSGGVCENRSTFDIFVNECTKNNIPFLVNSPWSNPLSDEEVKRRTQVSIIAAEIRGPEHLKNGFIPERIFKNISFGHLGMTNSMEVYKELEGHVILNQNPAQLFYDAMAKRTDYVFIEEAMRYVQQNHTHVNRIQALSKII